MPTSRPAVRRALISASDKRGLPALGQCLTEMGVEILSSGGSARCLTAHNVPVTEVAEHTGHPEIMGGRVKTLHPRVHGGILARRGLDDEAMAQHDIAPIDLVVVNLYPFEAVVAGEGCTLDEAIEHIDIGGPALARAAAKNWRFVGVLSDPAQYDAAIGELSAHQGLSDATRFRLAVEAFDRSARYDGAISDYLSSLRDDGTRSEFPAQANARFVKLHELRYGENPHQQAAFYGDVQPAPGTLATFRQRQGKSLSYNNIADADAAWECVRQFERCACAIVKHANPCGVAVAESPSDAYLRAFSCDPTSAFGGIVAFNRGLDARLARRVVENQFVEVLIAPEVDPDALTATRDKSDVRVLEIPPGDGHNRHDFKRIGAGVLVQTADNALLKRADLKCVSERAPSESELEDLLFAWRVAKYVKSNAIVYARAGQALGIGAGQMSRVDSARIAALKAADAGLALGGAVMASDAFFPFRDSIDAAAERGVAAVIQPGGSKRDAEVIAAADAHGMAMVFTGLRHFRH